jgi:ligand-binding sensor domain-containing protein
VNDIYYDSVDDSYWVAYVAKGISEVNVTAKTWTNHTLVQGLPSNTVYSITRAADNENKNNTVIWAATQGGLAKLVNSHWESYGLSGGLPSDRVRRVYSDDGQNLWVGLVNAGAVRIKI